MSFWGKKIFDNELCFLVGNGIRFLGCINAFASIRSLIRSLVYSAPKELALPRTKCSRSSGRKEIYFKDFSSKVSPFFISYPFGTDKVKKVLISISSLDSFVNVILSLVFHEELFLLESHSLYFSTLVSGRNDG